MNRLVLAIKLTPEDPDAAQAARRAWSRTVSLWAGFATGLGLSVALSGGFGIDAIFADPEQAAPLAGRKRSNRRELAGDEGPKNGAMFQDVERKESNVFNPTVQ